MRFRILPWTLRFENSLYLKHMVWSWFKNECFYGHCFYVKLMVPPSLEPCKLVSFRYYPENTICMDHLFSCSNTWQWWYPLQKLSHCPSMQCPYSSETWRVSRFSLIWVLGREILKTFWARVSQLWLPIKLSICKNNSFFTSCSIMEQPMYKIINLFISTFKGKKLNEACSEQDHFPAPKFVVHSSVDTTVILKEGWLQIFRSVNHQEALRQAHSVKVLVKVGLFHKTYAWDNF